MKKYYLLNGKINEECLEKLITFFNYLDASDTLFIYLSSTGGMTIIGRAIISFINNNKDRIELACVHAESSAFEIFYKSKCKKFLISPCRGMYHKQWVADAGVFSDNRKPVYNSDIAIFNNDKYYDFSYVKEFMNNMEFKKYKKGQDVYFNHQRMIEIFPDVEVLKD